MAFVGLVGLYACSVRRLEVRKRNAAYFLGFIGLLRSCSLLVVVVLLVVFFPFGRYDKKKGNAVIGAPSLFRGLWVCYMLINSSR